MNLGHAGLHICKTNVIHTMAPRPRFPSAGPGPGGLHPPPTVGLLRDISWSEKKGGGSAEGRIKFAYRDTNRKFASGKIVFLFSANLQIIHNY